MLKSKKSVKTIHEEKAEKDVLEKQASALEVQQLNADDKHEEQSYPDTSEKDAYETHKADKEDNEEDEYAADQDEAHEEDEADETHKADKADEDEEDEDEDDEDEESEQSEEDENEEDEDEEEEEDDEEDEEDEEANYDKYLEKIKNENLVDYLTKVHHESEFKNHHEVELLTKITKDDAGLIVDKNHKTVPFITKYEKARILGIRTAQLNNGTEPLIQTNLSNNNQIAQAEYNAKKMPFIIRRPLPNGTSEYWRFADLEQI